MGKFGDMCAGSKKSKALCCLGLLVWLLTFVGSILLIDAATKSHNLDPSKLESEGKQTFLAIIAAYPLFLTLYPYRAMDCSKLRELRWANNSLRTARCATFPSELRYDIDGDGIMGDMRGMVYPQIEDRKVCSENIPGATDTCLLDDPGACDSDDQFGYLTFEEERDVTQAQCERNTGYFTLFYGAAGSMALLVPFLFLFAMAPTPDFINDKLDMTNARRMALPLSTLLLILAILLLSIAGLTFSLFSPAALALPNLVDCEGMPDSVYITRGDLPAKECLVTNSECDPSPNAAGGEVGSCVYVDPSRKDVKCSQYSGGDEADPYCTAADCAFPTDRLDLSGGGRQWNSECCQQHRKCVGIKSNGGMGGPSGPGNFFPPNPECMFRPYVANSVATLCDPCASLNTANTQTVTPSADCLVAVSALFEHVGEVARDYGPRRLDSTSPEERRSENSEEEEEGGGRRLQTCKNVWVDIYVGSFGSEMSWRIDDAQGASPCGEAQGIGSNGNTHTIPCCLTSGTYTFVAQDSYGDGWNGGGKYSVYDDDQTLIGPSTVEGSGRSDETFTIVGGGPPTAPPTTASPTTHDYYDTESNAETGLNLERLPVQWYYPARARDQMYFEKSCPYFSMSTVCRALSPRETSSPSQAPSEAPSAAPSQAPTSSPTSSPTAAPSAAPSDAPSQSPTSSPSTSVPSLTPTTSTPSLAPTTPTNAPTPPARRRELQATDAPTLEATALCDIAEGCVWDGSRCDAVTELVAAPVTVAFPQAFCENLNTGSAYDQQECDGSKNPDGPMTGAATGGGYQWEETSAFIGSVRPDQDLPTCARVRGICSDTELCPFTTSAGGAARSSPATQKCLDLLPDLRDANKIHECSDICHKCCLSAGVEAPIHHMRLVDGPSKHEGRLEVFDRESGWGTVCDDTLDDGRVAVSDRADNLCKMMGFKAADSTRASYTGAYPRAQFGEGASSATIYKFQSTISIQPDDAYTSATFDAPDLLFFPTAFFKPTIAAESEIEPYIGGKGSGKTHCTHAEDLGLKCVPFGPTDGLLGDASNVANENFLRACVWNKYADGTAGRCEALPDISVEAPDICSCCNGDYDSPCGELAPMGPVFSLPGTPGNKCKKALKSVLWDPESPEKEGWLGGTSAICKADMFGGQATNVCYNPAVSDAYKCNEAQDKAMQSRSDGRCFPRATTPQNGGGELLGDGDPSSDGESLLCKEDGPAIRAGFCAVRQFDRRLGRIGRGRISETTTFGESLCNAFGGMDKNACEMLLDTRAPTPFPTDHGDKWGRPQTQSPSTIPTTAPPPPTSSPSSSPIQTAYPSWSPTAATYSPHASGGFATPNGHIQNIDGVQCRWVSGSTTRSPTPSPTIRTNTPTTKSPTTTSPTAAITSSPTTSSPTTESPTNQEYEYEPYPYEREGFCIQTVSEAQARDFPWDWCQGTFSHDVVEFKNECLRIKGMCVWDGTFCNARIPTKQSQGIPGFGITGTGYNGLKGWCTTDPNEVRYCAFNDKGCSSADNLPLCELAGPDDHRVQEWMDECESTPVDECTFKTMKLDIDENVGIDESRCYLIRDSGNKLRCVSEWTACDSEQAAASAANSNKFQEYAPSILKPVKCATDQNGDGESELVKDLQGAHGRFHAGLIMALVGLTIMLFVAVYVASNPSSGAPAYKDSDGRTVSVQNSRLPLANGEKAGHGFL